MSKITAETDKQVSISQDAIFLWQGFMDVVSSVGTRTPEQQELYDRHFAGLGQDSAAWSIGYVASIISAEYEKWAQHDFPGVYHYEIVETLGNWLAEKGPRLAQFQYSDKECLAATQLVVDRYNELMAGWLVEDQLTASQPRPDI